MYVLFEGIDTTGKSTQVELFAKRHSDVLTTKEPGGTALGLKLREILLQSTESIGYNAELLLFLADRAEHYEKIVKTSREKSLIISDRGMLSGVAYALANHPTLDRDFLIALNKFTLEDKLPDKIVLFITNKDLISARLDAKNHDSIEQRGLAYLLDIQKLMQDIVVSLGIPFSLIDATQSIEDIYKQIEDFLYD